MPGIVFLMDAFGDIVKQQRYECPYEINNLRIKWRSLYGKAYRDENVVIKKDPKKEKYIKPKVDYSKGVPGKAKKKGQIRASQYY